jgi:hypothetical protein
VSLQSRQERIWLHVSFKGDLTPPLSKVTLSVERTIRHTFVCGNSTADLSAMLLIKVMFSPSSLISNSRSQHGISWNLIILEGNILLFLSVKVSIHSQCQRKNIMDKTPNQNC